MPNFKSIVHFHLVDFCEGYLLLVVTCYFLLVTEGKQSQLLVRLTWTVLSNRTGVWQKLWSIDQCTQTHVWAENAHVQSLSHVSVITPCSRVSMHRSSQKFHYYHMSLSSKFHNNKMIMSFSMHFSHFQFCILKAFKCGSLLIGDWLSDLWEARYQNGSTSGLIWLISCLSNKCEHPVDPHRYRYHCAAVMY